MSKTLQDAKMASLKDKLEALEKEKQLEKEPAELIESAEEEKTAEVVEPAEEVKPRKSKKGMNKGNSTVTIIASVSLAIVVALGVAYFGVTGTKGDKGDRGLQGAQGIQGVQGLKGEKGDKGDRGLQGLQGPIGPKGLNGLNAKLGAVPGPDFYGPFWGVNNVRTYASEQIMTQSTSTICSLQSPNATSTLLMATVSFNVASSAVATAVDIARDTPVTRPIDQTSAVLGGGGFATSSLLISANYSIAAGAASTIFVSPGTSTAARDPNFVFGPNEFLVVKAEGLAAGTNIHLNSTGYVPTGTCKVLWLGTQRGN